jgi:hypothetical protein
MLRVFYKSAPHVKARLCAGDGSFEVNDKAIRDYWMFSADRTPLDSIIKSQESRADLTPS